ncbi:MAG: 4Fe-4S binding protein [Paramuribaculum sp.]|nr:4Fe-4S binding protein [Paramuribaculum sp.]
MKVRLTKYSLLRWSRICLSIAATGILTLSICTGASCMPSVGKFLESIQIGHAVMAFSMVIIVGWLLLTLAFGRIYCSSVCPMGTLQDIASRTARPMPLRRFGSSRRRYRYVNAQPRLRNSILTLTVLAIMGGINAVPSVIEPFAVFNRICKALLMPVAEKIAEMLPAGFCPAFPAMAAASLTATVIAIIILSIVAVISTRHGRRICNTVCPVGTALGFVSRFAIYQMEIDTDLCLNCGRCEDACKGECINLTDHIVDGSRCIVCFDCTNVCPNNAISFTRNRKRLSTPLMQKIIGLDRPPQTTIDCNTD